MDSDTDINIAIKTTADTAGAKQTVEAIKEIEKEDMTLQQQRDARTKGSFYGTATTADAAADAEVAAAKRVANAATMQAAMQEAAAVKAQRSAAVSAAASAEKARAEEAAAIKIEAALLKETLAADAAAAAGNKRLAMAALRAATPRNRQLSAAMSVAQNPEAQTALVGALTNPYVLAAAVVTLGVVTHKTFGDMKSDLDVATLAGSTFEQTNVKMATAIRILGADGKTAMETIEIANKKVAESVVKYIPSIHLLAEGWKASGMAAEMSAVAQEAAAARATKKIDEKYAERANAHAAMTKSILEDQQKIQNADDQLASDREKRAGMSSGQVAANEMARFVAKAAADDAIMVANLEILRKKHNEMLLKARDADTKAEQDTLNKAAEVMMTEMVKATNDIAVKRKVTSREITNKLEASEAEVKADLGEKIMANAKALQEDLRGLVDNGSTAPATRAALQQIDALMDSGKVSAEQLKTVIAGFGHSMDTTTVDQRTFLGDLSKSDEALVAAAKAQDAQIEQSTQNQAQVTEKVQATAEAQQTHHAATVESIATLAPTPADKQAVVTAVQDTGKAIADKDNAIIAALTAIQTAVAGVTSQIQNQQQQIDNLFSRIR